MIRLAVRVRREDAEVALADLLELAPAGVEEVDLPDEGLVEYAVYGAPGELPELPDLRAAAGGALVEVRTSEVGDDWAQRWRAFHQPVLVDHRLLVRAPWHEGAGGALEEVVVDPGQAFGTGAHATTRLCLELLLGLEDPVPPAPLVDVGCGSGVLAIAAAKLGWAPVLGVDHERESVAATLENAAANGVRVDARLWDLRVDEVP
jgi:ribosomal protein L11 methyltransferase